MTKLVADVMQQLVEPQVVYDIAQVIRSNDSFLIAGHLRPDGDCLGSGLGLYCLLKGMGKKVRFYTPGPLASYFTFLPYFDQVETQIPEVAPGEITIYVDSADPDRVDEQFRPQGYLVNIDHHISNTSFAQLNWIDSEATAAGEQIYRLALVLGQTITPEIATCLYTALMTDSGGFRFSNTDQMTFEAAAHLVRSGANPAQIAEAIFESRKPGTVRLIGEVYERLVFEFGGHFVWSEVTRDVYERVGGEEYEPEGLSSDIRGIEGVEISALFYETPDRQCRVGLRSKGKINVSQLAQQLGGGGHHNASGAMIREEYETAKAKVLDVVRSYLKTIYG